MVMLPVWSKTTSLRKPCAKGVENERLVSSVVTTSSLPLLGEMPLGLVDAGAGASNPAAGSDSGCFSSGTSWKKPSKVAVIAIHRSSTSPKVEPWLDASAAVATKETFCAEAWLIVVWPDGADVAW